MSGRASFYAVTSRIVPHHPCSLAYFAAPVNRVTMDGQLASRVIDPRERRRASASCLGHPRAKQQLQPLKQQYLQTTRDLEQRIAALEKQIQDQKAIREQKQVILPVLFYYLYILFYALKGSEPNSERYAKA